MQTFAERVTASRKAAGLSGEELARMVGVSQGAISKMETGATVFPSGEILFPLADALQVSARWLVTGEQAVKSDDSPLPKLPADMQRLLSHLGTLDEARVNAIFTLLGVKRG